MAIDRSHPTPPDAFGPAKKLLREGSSREHRGMQEAQPQKPIVGTKEHRAPLAAEGSISRVTVQERMRQLIAEAEKYVAAFPLRAEHAEGEAGKRGKKE